MASSTPTTPSVRRSNSLPASRTLSSPDPQIEVLYTLPYAKIIAFSSSPPEKKQVLVYGRPIAPADEFGTLLWSTQIERTLAVGPLRIYRAPGSVAFLNCANALRPILPKSQAWCVDGDSKFVLQIRPPQYWRIEVPNDTQDEKDRLEELKKVFAEILLFEKTPCPFQRDFTVELPEPTPVKIRPWKPVFQEPEVEEGPSSSSESASQTSSADTSYRSPTPVSPKTLPSISTQVRELAFPPEWENSPSSLRLERRSTQITVGQGKLLFDDLGKPTYSTRGMQTYSNPLETHYRPVNPRASRSASLHHYDPADGVSKLSLATPSLSTSASMKDSACSTDDLDSDSFSDSSELTPKGRFQRKFEPFITELEKVIRPMALEGSRSLTAPPLLSLVTSPPSKNRTKSPLRKSTAVETDSDFSSSVESFHSVQSWHSPLAPPSPPASQPSSPTTFPFPHENIILPKRVEEMREASEFTITPETPRTWDMIVEQSKAERASMSPKTPTTSSGSSSSGDNQSVLSMSNARPTFRHRATTNSRRRALSPLPAAANLFSPHRRRPASRRLQVARFLTSGIIQKTYEILLSPPSHLFHLMLRIASKIAAGEWRGVLSGYGEAVHWDFEDEYAGETWTENTSETRLPNMSDRTQSTGSVTSHFAGGSWEVD